MSYPASIRCVANEWRSVWQLTGLTMLPRSTLEPLRRQLVVAKALHEADLAAGVGEVELPHALARKYPRAPRQWAWKLVFPSHKLSTDPRSGVVRRHHLYDNYVARGVRRRRARRGSPSR